jgi:antitoxin (DNA-binding transcriptional repressor) of toxin-antitoxin stability system
MTTYSVAEAKNSLSDLIDRALKGEGVVITRHGAPVVEIRALKRAPRPLTRQAIEWLRANRTPTRPGVEGPSETLRKMRDEQTW